MPDTTQARGSSARISPTAHYTGFVWYRNGMSHPAFRTPAGWLLFHALRPANMAYRALGAPTLEGMLLARHRLLDHLLGRAIESGEIGQVVEIAAGLSPRGERFMRRFGGRGLVYVEGDLPAMVARKRRILDAIGPLRPGHHIVELDALADDGQASLGQVTRRLLDPGVGTAIVTEGLMSYFAPETAQAVWRRCALELARYPAGRYFSDLHLRSETEGVVGSRLFVALLSAFARGQVHVHFATEADARAAFAAAGFEETLLHRPEDFASETGVPRGAGGGLVRVVEARVDTAARGC